MKDLVARGAVGAHQPENDFGNIKITSGIPRCFIGQTTNVSGYAPGKFNFDKILSYEPTDRLKDVVLLKPNQGFVMFGETFKSPSRCGSSDGIVPDARYTEPISSQCNVCPMHKWDNTLTEGELHLKRNVQKALNRKNVSEKPECNEKIELLLTDIRYLPFVLTGIKTQVSIIQKNLINVLRYKSQGKRIFETMFDMVLVPGDSNKGNYVQLKFENFRTIEDMSIVGNYAELSAQYSNFSDVMRQQNAAMDKEREVNSEEEVPF